MKSVFSVVLAFGGILGGGGGGGEKFGGWSLLGDIDRDHGV